MKHNFCSHNESLAVIWDSQKGGMSECAASVLFPILLLILMAIRLMFLKPRIKCCSLFKRSSGQSNATSTESSNGFRSDDNDVSLLIPPQMESGVKRRKPRNSCLSYVFFCLNITMPLHYLLLLILGVTVMNLQFVWVWLFCAILLILAWTAAAYSVKIESKRSLDTEKKASYHHNVILFSFWVFAILYELVPVLNIIDDAWPFRFQTHTQVVEFVLWVLRVVHLLAVLLLGVYSPGLPRESRTVTTHDPHRRLFEGENFRLTSENESTFKNIWLKIKFLWPYVWPKGEPYLQLYACVCFLTIVAGRFANIFIPIFYSKVVEALSQNDLSKIPYSYILTYCLFYTFSGSGFGGSGLLSNLRSFLWIRVQQYSSRRTMVEIFTHLHNLSLRWHLSRRTGEVVGVTDRGNNSVITLLSYILFTIIPTIADVLIAIVFFLVAFNLYFGLIVFGCLSAFIAATITISEWRTKFRREVNLLDNATRTKAVDSLLNFETVKYYGAEKFEIERYETSLLKYQAIQWTNLASLQLLNLVQCIIVNFGLFAGCLLCAYYIVDGDLPVQSFVLFSTYIVQLYGPLNFLGTYYRMIQQSFIDMENMLDLFMEKQEVKDAEGCSELSISGGDISFENVSFHYQPEKPILKNISFRVPAGSTVAIVGPSGSGKSTIIRLLFRFYDVQSGVITVDGEDISKVSQSSLRKNIGVVPQDTVLFNDTIGYNIRYGRFTASDAEVFEAADKADMHSRIQQFPDKYETKVGERGLKLSGGEKQRVAIARTVLKAPKVILLDEATSALDTKTERNIQASLDAVSKDRTTLVVAHRLSTIVNADMILVLKEGVIVERGTHNELVNRCGSVYSEMWSQQIVADSSSPSAADDKAELEE